MAKSWEGRLVRSARGGLTACPRNIILMLTHSPEWEGVLAFDQFVNGPVKLKTPPWRREARGTDDGIGDWTEVDTTRLSDWLSAPKQRSLIVSSSMIEEAVRLVAERTPFHPIRDWLSGLTWDQKPRLDSWLIRMGGAEDTPYVQAVGAKFLISAIARIFEPGCKADCVPIFEGAQGVGKSTMLRILFGEKWFLETTIELGGKDSYQMLRRTWGIELGELESMSRSEMSRVKAFLSARVDTYRPSYGRTVRDFPRQVVFAATHNPEGGGYLKDNTGARRFLPVEIRRRVHFKALEAEREQLWAEARVRYLSGEAWYLQTPELIEVQKAVTEERRQKDIWEAPIAKWLEDHKLSARKGITTHRILKELFKYDLKELGRTEEMRVAAILRLMGVTEKFRSTEPGRPWMYRKPRWPGASLVEAPKLSGAVK